MEVAFGFPVVSYRGGHKQYNWIGRHTDKNSHKNYKVGLRTVAHPEMPEIQNVMTTTAATLNGGEI